MERKWEERSKAMKGGPLSRKMDKGYIPVCPLLYLIFH